jgi:hypothetical protein
MKMTSPIWCCTRSAKPMPTDCRHTELQGHSTRELGVPRPIPVITVLVAALHIFAGAALAQSVIEGAVFEGETEVRIPGATVSVLTAGHEPVARTLTDEDGRFRMTVERPGAYRIRAEALGFLSVTSDTVRVLRDDSVRIQIRLGVEPLALDPVVVVGRRQEHLFGGLLDFERRRERGFGVFFTAEEIEARGATYLTDVLRMVPGVRVMSDGRPSGGRVFMRRTPIGMRGCPVQVWVDGVREPLGRGHGINDVVHPLDIEGIEIYRGLSGVPAEFFNEFAHCGVIVIWTRRG